MMQGVNRLTSRVIWNVLISIVRDGCKYSYFVNHLHQLNSARLFLMLKIQYWSNIWLQCCNIETTILVVSVGLPWHFSGFIELLPPCIVLFQKLLKIFISKDIFSIGWYIFLIKVVLLNKWLKLPDITNI